MANPNPESTLASIKKDAYDVLRSSYASVSRTISTEAAYTASSQNACFDQFQLIEIPDVMEKKMQAGVGAALMRRWFASPKFVLPENWRAGDKDFLTIPSHHLDTAIVKMEWVRRFTRANVAIATLEGRINTPLALKELRRVLKRQHFLTNAREKIGQAESAVVLHETSHLNSLAVAYGGGVDPLDCGLAAFTMHVAVSGTSEPIVGAAPNQNSHRISIEKLNFYVRDSYDFNTEDEPLGYWGREGASASVMNIGMSYVENRHFRLWRERHGRGGDFIIFSDVFSKKLPRPILVEI